MAEAAEAFLKSVLRSGLLDKTQLQDALRSFPKDRADKPQELAKHLIQAMVFDPQNEEILRWIP